MPAARGENLPSESPACPIRLSLNDFGVNDSWTPSLVSFGYGVGNNANDSKYALPFTLLADEKKVALKAFGTFGKKLMYGKEVEGVIRSTFIVGPDGVIRKVFPKVKPEGHAAEVLRALKLMDAI